MGLYEKAFAFWGCSLDNYDQEDKNNMTEYCADKTLSVSAVGELRVTLRETRLQHLIPDLLLVELANL